MKKLLFIAVIIGLFSGASFAQSGNVKIGIGAETNFFASNNYSTFYDAGFGGNIKGFYGLNNASDLTLTAGYTHFAGKSGLQFAGQPIGVQTLSLVPLLAGYRYNLAGGFYGEGQVGLGILSTQASGASFSQTNFAAAINVGYTYHNFDLSLRYYTEGDVVSVIAVRLGYNFSLK